MKRKTFQTGPTDQKKQRLTSKNIPEEERKYKYIVIFAWKKNIEHAMEINKWASPNNDTLDTEYQKAIEAKQEVLLFFSHMKNGVYPEHKLVGLARMKSRPEMEPEVWPRSSPAYSGQKCFRIDWIRKDLESNMVRAPNGKIYRDGVILTNEAGEKILTRANVDNRYLNSKARELRNVQASSNLLSMFLVKKTK